MLLTQWKLTNEINTGFINGLVPSGNKPLPQSVMTKPMTPDAVFMSQWFKCETYGFISLIWKRRPADSLTFPEAFWGCDKDSFRRLQWTPRNRTTFSSVYMYIF